MQLYLTKILHRAVAIFGLTALISTSVLADDPDYLSAVADLPLPPGMVEDLGAGISFDKPEGRIVEALARGAVTKADVTIFYRASLPELGWRKLTDDASGSSWQRGDERLDVDIVDNGNPLIVRFSIAPN